MTVDSEWSYVTCKFFFDILHRSRRQTCYSLMVVFRHLLIERRHVDVWNTHHSTGLADILHKDNSVV